jgi:spermidine synthase
MLKLFLLLIFFFSGLCGLMYEIVWLRMLGLVFGTTVYAASTVLAAFMAGLALGNFYFGRFSDQTKGNLLRSYAFLEAGIGISALLVPVIFSGLSGISGTLSNSLPVFLFGIIRFSVVFLALLLPTTLMGGTLPVISKFLIREINQVGKNVGLLYGINTAGAVAGCFLSGFIFINLFGLKGTTYLAAIVNLVLAVCLWRLGAGSIQKKSLPDSTPPKKVPGEAGPADRIYLVLMLFAVSGFSALAYEVFWTRVLVFLFNSTVYSFAIMLGTFLFGLTCGSLVMASIVDNRKRLIFLFGALETGIGLLTAASLLLYPLASDALSAFELLLQTVLHFTPWISWILARFCVALPAIFLPAFLFGATFPVVNKLCIKNLPRLGFRLGSAYSINTIGAIAGSLCAGFVLIPLLGIQKGMFSVAVLNCIIGIILIAHERTANRILAPALGIPALLLLFLISGNVDFGKPLVFFGTTYTKQDKKSLKTVAYKEDVGATVSVLETGSQGRLLNIDGFNTAGTFRYEYMRMLGHLPMLLHQGTPQKALVICFGTGTTSGTLDLYHPGRIDCAEISRAVIEVAPYFLEQNRDIVRASNFRLIINDGRNHLLGTREMYDVITLEPMHPYISSAVNLYSCDFYRLCRKHLNEDGVLCQWIPLHVMSSADHRMLVKTFAAVFPYTTVWFVNTESIIIGSRNKLTIDFTRLRKKLSDPGISRDLTAIGLGNVYSLLNSFVLGEAGVKKYTDKARSIVTDDHPSIEFSAPKSLVSLASDSWVKNVEQLTDCIEPVAPLCINTTGKENDTINRYFQNNESIYVGRMYQARGNLDKASSMYSAARAFNPDDDAVKYCIKNLNDELKYYYYMLGEQCRRKNLTDMALDFFRKTLAIDSQFVQAHIGMSAILNEKRTFADPGFDRAQTEAVELNGTKK